MEKTHLKRVIQIEDQYYVHATSSFADDRTRIIKYGESFAIFDRLGDIHPLGRGEQGIYFKGTRFLSRLELGLGHHDRPLLLNSNVRDDSGVFTVNLTNPEILDEDTGGVKVPDSALHIQRLKFLKDRSNHERIAVRNYSNRTIRLPLHLFFGADFVDIFEVRGMKRKHRGELLTTQVDNKEMNLRYVGLDEIIRRTKICFDKTPDRLDENSALFELALEPYAEQVLTLSMEFLEDDEESHSFNIADELEELESSDSATRKTFAHVHSSNEDLNDWYNRSVSDLSMLSTQIKDGLYPFAGVPWFSTYFGRDGLITALECLWVNPTLAQGVLRYLAAEQATENNPQVESNPGKILHEVRSGEMINLGELPFGRYYGSVDSTPLFVILAGEYYQRTGDLELIEDIWEPIKNAFHWIQQYGDRDADQFIEYSTEAIGLIHQGWKDSQDSVFHEDGSDALGNIALCEVQGYVYDAYIKGAYLAEALGDQERVDDFLDKAKSFKERFNQTFWDEQMNFYILALDGNKRPCRVKASNAGHLLHSGIASPEQAQAVARTLLSSDFFSGWGIRTLSQRETRYNPMSYHNGSIWPHDNSMIAMGLDRYGLKAETEKVFNALFESSVRFDLKRLPELFCGFAREPSEGPTLYPVACSPQAWAAATVFALLKSLLGIEIDAPRKLLRFNRPVLPNSLESLNVFGLQIGESEIDFSVRRFHADATIQVLRKTGPIQILIEK